MHALNSATEGPTSIKLDRVWQYTIVFCQSSRFFFNKLTVNVYWIVIVLLLRRGRGWCQVDAIKHHYHYFDDDSALVQVQNSDASRWRDNYQIKMHKTDTQRYCNKVDVDIKTVGGPTVCYAQLINRRRIDKKSRFSATECRQTTNTMDTQLHDSEQSSVVERIKF